MLQPHRDGDNGESNRKRKWKMKWELLGFREQGYLPIMENQMDKNTKIEMETTIYV